MNYRPYSVYKAERLHAAQASQVAVRPGGPVRDHRCGHRGLVSVAVREVAEDPDRRPQHRGRLGCTSRHANLFPAPAGTMNILVLGIDNRGWEMIRSDSMMIVHADPGNNYLSTLSLPRDLRVEVPGYGTAEAQLRLREGWRGTGHQDGCRRSPGWTSPTIWRST